MLGPTGVFEKANRHEFAGLEKGHHMFGRGQAVRESLGKDALPEL